MILKLSKEIFILQRQIALGQYETSEDSASQAASSVVSDEAAPILGRRAEREHAGDSRLSDSDFSDDLDWPPFKVLNQGL